MGCKPPYWTWLANGGLWGEHSSERCHRAHADRFSITDRDDLTSADRDDLANGDGNACRQRDVSL
jgi:hypothetical protein